MHSKLNLVDHFLKIYEIEERLGGEKKGRRGMKEEKGNNMVKICSILYIKVSKNK